MLSKIYRYLNILSLDVAVGASICTVYLSKFFHVDISWPPAVVLGLTVWLIYTFDHLQDSRKIGSSANTIRYLFHQRYSNILTICCVGVLILISMLVFKLSSSTLMLGSALSCLVIAYFIFLHFLGLKASYHKEVSIAVIYSTGIFLAPFSLYKGQIFGIHILIFMQFVNMAFINLMIFSWLENDKDRHNNFPSLVHILGIKLSKTLIFVLLLAQLLTSVFLINSYKIVDISYIILAMTTILGGIAFFSEYFVQNERYRVIGDFVFLIPVLGLI